MLLNWLLSASKVTLVILLSSLLVSLALPVTSYQEKGIKPIHLQQEQFGLLYFFLFDDRTVLQAFSDFWSASEIKRGLNDIYRGSGFLSHDSTHRLNMELDLQSFFGLHVYSCTHWLRPRKPPRIWAQIRGRYWSALGSQNWQHLFVFYYRKTYALICNWACKPGLCIRRRSGTHVIPTLARSE